MSEQEQDDAISRLRAKILEKTIENEKVDRSDSVAGSAKSETSSIGWAWLKGDSPPPGAQPAFSQPRH